jgi:hypothetical protein
MKTPLPPEHVLLVSNYRTVVATALFGCYVDVLTRLAIKSGLLTVQRSICDPITFSQDLAISKRAADQ